MKQETVRTAIFKLIDDDGYQSLNTVPDSEVEGLLGLYISEMGKFGLEAISEPEEAQETVNCFIAYLLTGVTDTAIELAETMRDNARHYLFKSIERIFDEMYSEIHVDRKRESGLHPIVDHVNGETRWVR